eukprot:scaffold165990_cov28-Tisochrysis_lutea.AAC.2
MSRGEAFRQRAAPHARACGQWLPPCATAGGPTPLVRAGGARGARPLRAAMLRHCVSDPQRATDGRPRLLPPRAHVCDYALAPPSRTMYVGRVARMPRRPSALLLRAAAAHRHS